MQTAITRLEELILYKNKIEAIYSQYGSMPQQSFSSYYSKMENMGDENVIVYLDDVLPCILAFERRKKDGIYQSIADLYPILGRYVSLNKMKEILQSLQNAYGVIAFYFPQIDANSSLATDAILDMDFIYWKRLDCPVYKNLEYKNNGYRYPDCCNHPHNREKKLLKIAYIKSLTSDEAEAVIRSVELSSWKYTCKQDMISRNQIQYYMHLIKNKIISVTALLSKADNDPIAYRIDSLINDTVFVIKWSYNMAYAKLSPGSFLATRELFMHYSNNEIAVFNLYGSPDSLKDRIENDRVNRIDLVFVNGQQLSVVEELKCERIAHDQRISKAYENRQSIQSIYVKP